MIQYINTPKEPLSTGFNQQNEQDFTFEKFLELTEIASSLISLEKRMITQDAQDRKMAIVNKKRIMPPILQRGLKQFNAQEYQRQTSRKLSSHLPLNPKRLQESSLPKISKRQPIKSVRKWALMRRRDEINLLPTTRIGYRYPAISQPKINSFDKKYSGREHGRLFTEQSDKQSHRLSLQKAYK